MKHLPALLFLWLTLVSALAWSVPTAVVVSGLEATGLVDSASQVLHSNTVQAGMEAVGTVERMTVGGLHGLSPNDDSAGQLLDGDYAGAARVFLETLSPFGNIDIQTLRSPAWLREHQCAPGTQLWLHLEELGIQGNCDVLALAPCPSLRQGPGRLVLSTTRSTSTFLLEIRFQGVDPPLRVTAQHLIRSAGRDAWLPAASLTEGESIRTSDGTAVIEAISVSSQQGVPVCNLEVQVDHCYFVGSSQLLAHNTCAAGRGGARPGAGRPGKPSVQEQDQEWGEYIQEVTGVEHVAGGQLPQRRFPDKGVKGNGSRYPDTINQNSEGGAIYMNSYSTNSRGGMTTEESKAAVDIISEMTGGDIFIGIPKLDPKK